MIKPIKTKKEYKAALQHIYELMQKDLKPGSKQSDELEVMSILVESYEKALCCTAAASHRSH